MMKHLLTIEDLSQDQIMSLIHRADHFLTQPQTALPTPPLAGQTLANLFFEPSTRTRMSFELAAKRLGMDVVNFQTQTSSTQKGETLLDTFRTLEAMGCHAVILRHASPGVCASCVNVARTAIHVVNAGEGDAGHPSQALLDMLTIFRAKKDFSQLRIAIVGDVRHSRVARSNLQALKRLQVPDIRIVSPAHLFSETLLQPGVSHHLALATGLKNVDVIMILRIQQERMLPHETCDIAAYRAAYSVGLPQVQMAAPDAIVMHPGPMNREIEISAAVADGPQSVIWEQVRCGVAMRMAILTALSE